MQGILQKIVAQKRTEVDRQKEKLPLPRLLKNENFNRQPYSMKSAIMQGSGVIAEFKRASPSKGLIRAGAKVKAITSSYQKAGVSAISVLADEHFFKARPDDLIITRQSVNIPILRKEFIIDEYQIYHAKALGADCILLIAAILTKEEICSFIDIAANLGLECIIEVHNTRELEKLSGKEALVGVNNRNLDTFEVSIETSLNMATQLGAVVKISESGLGANDDIAALVAAGYQGFLVGERFMKSPDPGKACKTFVEMVKTASR